MNSIDRQWIDLPDALPQVDLKAERVVPDAAEVNAPELGLRKRWTTLVQGVREQYKGWKERLMDRTDETLTEIADQYVGDWRETQPTTMWQSAKRAVEATRKSLTLRKAMDLSVRGALVGIEFNAQMAAKQFLVDIAIRQADCDTLAEKYAGHGGVAAVEAEAMKFADQVRQHFAELQRVSERMMPAEGGDREAYRQQHIERGMKYAHELLQGVTIIPEQRRQAILGDIHRHLDTVVFDGEKSSLMRGYEKLSGQWSNAIQGIVERHVDIYQARKARNTAVLTTGARWLTLGVESFVIGKAMSTYSTVSVNYEKALQQRPAHERTTGKRLEALAESVRTSLRQFALHDRFELALRNNKTVSASVERLITPEQQAADFESFAVDQIAISLWTEYGEQLKARGISEDDLYARVEDIAAFQGDRRQALERLLKHKLLGMHREVVKASAKQYEHLFNQFNATVTTLGMLEHLDTTLEAKYVPAVDATAANIETVLTHLQDAVQEITVTRVTSTDSASAVVTIPDSYDYSYDALHQSVDPEAFAAGEEVPPENTVANVHYVVESGETTWKIASDHLEWYRQREGNDHLTVPQAVELLARDNHLTNAARIEVGQTLVLPTELPPAVDDSDDPYGESVEEAPRLPEGMWEQDRVMSHEQAVMAAKGVDHHLANDHYVSGATREDLNKLPPGDYVTIFGERMGKRNNTMGVFYDQVYDLHVDATGAVTAKEHGVADTTPMDLSELLSTEQAPIVRVFSLEATDLTIDHGRLNSAEWSDYNLAMIESLKHEAVRVEDKDGAYCAKDMAGRFNLMAEQLAAKIGVNIIDGRGELSGVTVHAPMVAEAIITNGGQELATLKTYFTVDAGGAHPQENLNSDNAVYRYGVDQWIKAAAANPLEIGTFYFTGTHINDIIAANREIGGEPNSHVVTLLGEQNHELTVPKDTTMAALLHNRFGLSKTDLAERGYLFESLGIEVNGQVITNQAEWLQQPVQAGDEIVIHDVALNHRFNGDHADTLVTMLVNDERLIPVSILEPNAEIMNAALRGDPTIDNAVMVDQFMQVKAGQGLAELMGEAGLSSDLWKAAEFVLAERGINPETVRTGDLVPIYNEEALRAQLDTIYERAEQRMEAADGSGVQVHIVRPHESMDDLAAGFFDRERYSAAEWAQIRDQIAYKAQIPNGEKAMPGDLHTMPYTIKEYHLQADAVIKLDDNTLADFEKHIWQQRADERAYLPDTLPIAVEDGIVEQAIPDEISRLIDTVVDSNPEYGEQVRIALALVYANEGMRETADQNWLTEQLAWVNAHLVDRSATLEQAMIWSEYLTSRQAQKDVAWAIQDQPMAKAVLDSVIAQAKVGSAERRALVEAYPTALWLPGEFGDSIVDPIIGQMEKVAGVSSAGLFQVRANNFFEKTDPAHDQLEVDLRADPLLNTHAAAEILHRNEAAIDTYVAAFGDPQAKSETAHVLALVNSYNGGPYKTMLGSLQERILYFADHEHVQIPLEQASGRNTEATQAALLAMCDQLRSEGKLMVPQDQVERDVALLGKETIGFLRSDTMQQLKGAYEESTGQSLSILPTADRLTDAKVSYANYALLSTRGGSLDAIIEHSQNVRIAQGNAVVKGYARNLAIPYSSVTPS